MLHRSASINKYERLTIRSNGRRKKRAAAEFNRYTQNHVNGTKERIPTFSK